MHKSLKIKINLENDAFQGGRASHEVARILHELALEILDNEHIPEKNLHDINGNSVGCIKPK